MAAGVRIDPPVSAGGRVIFPLVRRETACSTAGGTIVKSPVALLVLEDDRRYFVPLENGIAQDIL